MMTSKAAGIGAGQPYFFVTHFLCLLSYILTGIRTLEDKRKELKNLKKTKTVMATAEMITVAQFMDPRLDSIEIQVYIKCKNIVLESILKVVNFFYIF